MTIPLTVTRLGDAVMATMVAIWPDARTAGEIDALVGSAK